MILIKSKVIKTQFFCDWKIFIELKGRHDGKKPHIPYVSYIIVRYMRVIAAFRRYVLDNNSLLLYKLT